MFREERTVRAHLSLVDGESEGDMPDEGVVFAEWVAFLEQRVISRLPADCEWLFVAQKVRRGLLSQLGE